MKKKLISGPKDAFAKVTLASLVLTLGIVYGDIGTSPLYVMSAIVTSNGGIVSSDYVLGGVSLVIWTLTLQTTIKYVWQILRADNNGEGGILSLYSLLKNKAKWLIIPAIIGSAALLSDGIITPAVTVTSAIEGLKMVFPLEQGTVVIIVAVIISILFLIQRSGTDKVGRVFGPIMLGWFSMLAILGLINIPQDWGILQAFNPYFGLKLLFTGMLDGKAALILGAVFLCTTGAEALYSDLGHCGRKNIYYTWIFVKTALILNYLGQGAVLLGFEGQMISGNPFFMAMPEWMLLFGIGLATFAAVIASQSLISGSFTLVSEAIKLRIFPRLKISYPSNVKGQVYIAAANLLLYIGCMIVLFHFREASAMEAAYGLSITVAMLMTTFLYFNYLLMKHVPKVFAIGFLCLYLVIEGSFLTANLFKFMEGGYITVIFALVIMGLMYIWMYGNRVTDRIARRVSLKKFTDQFLALQVDNDVERYCTNLVYMTKCEKRNMVEKEVIHSILERQPKRADVYWFVNIIDDDSPFTTEYRVDHIVPNKVIKVQFVLGFRVERKVAMLMRTVVTEMIEKGEIPSEGRIYSMNPDTKVGDFRFVLLEDVLSNEGNLTSFDSMILRLKFKLKQITVTPAKWFGLDTSNVTVEQYPILLGKHQKVDLQRID
ncbi:KUP/HAK/KT family potassium transporter [Culicoidibacter larvae]|uniref:Probable potassium transport system protein Kup n=1 Tax=Culicoidibacter larvae TaxID=2579976 RepID=A0A5R8QFX0_9FIRM|nr:KUP/HAK/KT family potassium transporter [Culicoidibacter larvae]TLG76646.1 potassium transporter Kup [Culicoidibacter larvae]